MVELEPVLDWENIQGNVLAGFNKHHQTLLGYAFDGDAAKAKSFVAGFVERITPLRCVVSFKNERKTRMSAADSSESQMRATWLAAAFSFAGLKLLAADSESFRDTEFRNGLAASSSRLGDPPGSAAAWKIGSQNNVPDVLLIVAADQEQDRIDGVESLVNSAGALGLREIYQETGHDLSHYSDGREVFSSGHEHFGFKDGISQPGVRGRLANGDFLTPRPAADTPDGIAYAAPGQPLVCAGEFVLGYASQIDDFPRTAGPCAVFTPAPNAIAPEWARNGSFLVFRRLQQNVEAFRQFAEQVVSTIPGLEPPKAAAMLVGRWPSGAALVRSPSKDDRAQAASQRINAFAYGTDNTTLGLPVDSSGVLCPVAAHIRKVNPRDEDTDQGAASATLTHRILRRGIPYGAPLPARMSERVPGDRGLLFLSYQASISRQFEFLASQWMNRAELPRNPSGDAEGMGFDLVIGQNAVDRVRFANLYGAPGERRIDTSGFTPKDWVVATGGGYFFAPSIAAMREVLAK